MILNGTNERRASLAYFRREITARENAAGRLGEELRDLSDELSRDGYLTDADEATVLLRRAAGLAEQAQRLAALAESKLPPAVR